MELNTTVRERLIAATVDKEGFPHDSFALATVSVKDIRHILEVTRKINFNKEVK